MSQRLGIDVGGTFTDVVVVMPDGHVVVEKVSSTPGDPSEGIFDGVRKVESSRGVVPGEVSIFSQGSTVATNALLEFKLPKTALITTKGFADVLEITDQVRVDPYDLRVDRPEPYVTRDLVFEVSERMDRLGNVVTELSGDDVESAIDAVIESGVEACAICFLFSFRNPEHEKRVAARLKERAPHIEVAISSAVAPELGEFGRANTVSVSAALQPLIARYMSRIVAGSKETGLDCPAYVMQSNGGVMSVDEASENAHRMVLSGPAGGVLAATMIAERSGHKNLITFDMGGTSTDIALVHEGKATPVRQSIFHHKPLMVPQFDIHTIGSGGGSLAWVDESGLLRVGPQSAGAVPGPACYGRGGTRPTTTDAHVVLGRVHPDNFLGGEMVLDREAAIRAVTEHVAEPLGISVEEAASGILEVANTLMSKGVRVVSVNRGFDPNDFKLLPFGGAGGMHAVDVARIVGASGVVVPQHPGILSALGMAGADLKYDYMQVIDEAVDRVDIAQLNQVYNELIAQSEERVGPAGAESVSHERTVRLRYAWQEKNDLLLTLPEGELTEKTLGQVVDEFHERHHFVFGHSDPDGTVELFAVGVETTGHLIAAVLKHSDDVVDHEPEPTSRREVYFPEGGWLDTPLYDRSALKAGANFVGPAIVEEREATTVIPPGMTVHIDGDYNIEINFA